MYDLTTDELDALIEAASYYKLAADCEGPDRLPALAGAVEKLERRASADPSRF